MTTQQEMKMPLTIEEMLYEIRSAGNNVFLSSLGAEWGAEISWAASLKHEGKMMRIEISEYHHETLTAAVETLYKRWQNAAKGVPEIRPMIEHKPIRPGVPKAVGDDEVAF